MRKVIPFVSEDYFNERVEKEVFVVIREFINKYNKFMIYSISNFGNVPK